MHDKVDELVLVHLLSVCVGDQEGNIIALIVAPMRIMIFFPPPRPPHPFIPRLAFGAK